MNPNFRKSIGKFDFTFQSDCDELTYFTFNSQEYDLINQILETSSTIQSFNRISSKINISGLNTPKYSKNKEILKPYSKDENCELYHIKDCTIQIFKFQNPKDLAGILIINLDQNKRTKAIETLYKLLT